MPEIGETLREARMRQKIDISEVEAETKIRAKYLRALENEEWDLLPEGSTFVRSFLRTYAEYLGLDAKLLVEEYKSRHERLTEIELTPVGQRPYEGDRGGRGRRGPRGPRGPRPSRGLIIGASIVALVVLLGVLGSISNNDNNSTTTKTVSRHRKPVHHPHVAPKPTVPKQVKLGLIPTSQVYVCLQNAKGKQLLNQSLLVGNNHNFTSKSFRLTVG